MKTVLTLLCLLALPSFSQQLGPHKAVYDGHGILQPWTGWEDAMDREMEWYRKCPVENGYPNYVWMTFMDGNYQPIERRHDTIPSMQNGMGIISYLKYYRYKERKPAWVLEHARAMGDYLAKEALTPDAGKYPRFTRSTGVRGKFPQPPDCGTQRDRPYEVEPDKGGIAGYALALLYEETKTKSYLDQAVQNARVLAANLQPGDATHSPWPMRVDYRTGDGRGPVCADMVYILRLFDKLIALGHSEFQAPREKLWTWIKTWQIPSAKHQGELWVQFFEDYELPDNRNSWSPLNLARYLIERQEALDPDWKDDAKTLIDFAIRNFTSIQLGVPVCGEQDHDKNAWGGANSTYGAVLAMYSAATGSAEYKGLAWQSLTFCLYATEEDGCPRDSVQRTRGGWQEDAHTDKIHNVVDALTAFPNWAGEPK